jgi:hypothetical protein
MREIKLSQKARDIQAAKTSSATPKTKKKNKSPGEDTNQWPDDGVFRSIHPDNKGCPTAALVDDERRP